MGADIHFYTERYTSSNNYEGPRDLSEDRDNKIGKIIGDVKSTERWVSADLWNKEDYWINESKYSSRNYYLFSILADVRNYNVIDPISEPKGIPDDASFGYLYCAKKWQGDAHSHSYFTLKELLDVDWSVYKLEYLETFLDVIEDLKGIDEDPSKVRICFFFDN
jgi:hypothetical protein